MSHLFSSFPQREVTLRNRIVVSPMCQYSATDGLPNDWHLVHLGARAVGGAGLVLTEATAVTPEGRISPADLGLWNDDQAAAFARITTFVKAQGAVPGVQLAHAGRKASTTAPWTGGGALTPDGGAWTTVAPSALPFDADRPAPRALTADEIEGVITAFRAAAGRALAAGFDIVEVHAAHGYLLHQFMSPVSNHRTDQYGGSFENRVRLPLAVVRAVRDQWPRSKPVWVRISATDYVDGGWTVDESVRFASLCRESGVDLIDCSSGGIAPGIQIPTGPGYQVHFARRIRDEARIATGAVGQINTATQAEDILARGDADLILLARELLRRPQWPLMAAADLNIETEWPKQYDRARPMTSRRGLLK